MIRVFVIAYLFAYTELTKLPLLEKLFLDNNKLTVLPPELGVVKKLKVLTVDCNMLVSAVDACSALTSLSSDVSVALQLMKCDIMQPVKRLGFVSDMVTQKMLNKDVMKSLKLLCAHKDPEIQLQVQLQRQVERQVERQVHEHMQQQELEANAREETREREWRQKMNDINSMLRKFSDPHPLIS
ncbi:hypothetical protein CTI12_AA586060 [Artemisia annua]|uniref:Leucine-rich repeat domain, L domain-like protein n=1 Tax=Artemisia annua TaxID=35608 RepID=A0A2U1KM87_ARTAN|nr:hypothetical protein CTI12_AA586060 [Artemisia annua]